MNGPPGPGQRITGPFIVPRDAGVEQRLVWLDQIVREAASDPKMKAAAQRVLAEAHRTAVHTPTYRGQWFERIVALEALRLAHSVPYVAGPPGDDEFAPASWTLEHGGDCDRLGSMLAGLVCLCGLLSRVDWLTQPQQSLDHVAVEIALDKRWYWAEPSVRGAVLGETPYEAVARQGAWHVVGQGPGPRPDGVGARAFAWSGWEELWKGWPVAWFQRHYPYLFHPQSRTK